MRYHLWFKDSSQNLPHGVPSHSGAISGAPVSSYWYIRSGCGSGMYFVHWSDILTLAGYSLRVIKELLLPVIALTFFYKWYYSPGKMLCKELLWTFFKPWIIWKTQKTDVFCSSDFLGKLQSFRAQKIDVITFGFSGKISKNRRFVPPSTFLFRMILWVPLPPFIFITFLFLIINNSLIN